VPRRLMLLSLALFAVVPVAQAGAAPAYTTKAYEITVKVGPDNATSCTVQADLYTPAGADDTHPAPAILATNGFGGSKADFSDLGPSYATRGYVFLAYSGLGFGGSQCKIELDDPDWDGKAARQMISFLGGSKAAVDGTRLGDVIHDSVDHAGQHESDDPRVGMIGGSYGGEIQFAAADVDPRLDTIVPEITWNNLAYSLAPNNVASTHGVDYPVAVPGVEKFDWVSLFFGLGIVDGVQGSSTGDPSHITSPCVNFDDRACTAKAQMDALGYPDADTLAFALHASVTSYMKNIRIPTFLAQGQSDTLFNLREAVATYDALRAQGTPVRMLWKSAGHSGGDLGAGEDDAKNPEAGYASRAYLEWFDYYLRGLGDPPHLNFSYYRDWVPFPAGHDAAPAVATAPAYPVAADTAWYLSGSGDLVSSRSAIKSGSAPFVVNPQAPASYTETSAVDQSNPVTDTPGTFAAFASAPLAADTDVVGIPRVTVKLDAPTFTNSGQPADQLVLFAKLYDVAPDGTIDLPHRLISPVRIGDLSKPVTIMLPGIVHRFKKGDTIRLVLAASDAAYRNNAMTGPVTVTVDPAAPSELDIPVLGSGPAPAPVAAPAGTQSPGAGVQPQVLHEAASTQAATLPTAARGCSSRTTLRIRLRIRHNRRHSRVRYARITVNGRHVKTLRTHRQLAHPYTLRGLPRRRTFRVVVTELTTRGQRLRSARTYNTGCH
jgi:predicted acyl esterase